MQAELLQEAYSLENGIKEGDASSKEKLQEIIGKSSDVIAHLVVEEIQNRVHSSTELQKEIIVLAKKNNQENNRFY